MPKSKRKIAVVTGNRAEYGLLYWIIKGIHEAPDLELQLIVTGMHLAPEFGMTVKVIENDGFPISEKVEMLLSSDSVVSIPISMGLGMIAFAGAYDRLKPDMLLVLGDRFEVFAAVSAAVPMRIPVGHIHGGEATEGVMDEQFRHALTKMSSFHFAATKTYADRIIQMGENPVNVHCFGAPGLDSINLLKLYSRKILLKELNLPDNIKFGVVTFHPEIIKGFPIERQASELLRALKEFSDIFWIFTKSNADAGGRAISGIINDFVVENTRTTKFFDSLGQLKYLSLLKCADLMIGNSSSGIIEAPSFNLAVVNIGDRQKGRIRAKNVIDVRTCKKEAIIKAIRKALSNDFRNSLKSIENPYGKGNASKKIIRILRLIKPTNLICKKFYENTSTLG